MDCILKIHNNPDRTQECIRAVFKSDFQRVASDPGGGGGGTVISVQAGEYYVFKENFVCNSLQEQFLRYADAAWQSRPQFPFIDALTTGILIIMRKDRRLVTAESNKGVPFNKDKDKDIKKTLSQWGLLETVKKSRRRKTHKEYTRCVTVDCVEYTVKINTRSRVTYIYFNMTPDSKLPELLCSYNRNIKQELNNILNMISLLNDTNPGHFQLEYTNRINQSTMSMISLLNDYNDYYVIRTHPERITLKPVNVSVANLVANAVSIIKTKYDFNVVFQLKIHKNISSVSVDRNKLLQLILNVISNGLQTGTISTYVISCKKVDSAVSFTHSYVSGQPLSGSPGVYGVFAIQLIKVLSGTLVTDTAEEIVYSIPVSSPVYDSSNSSDSVETVESIDISGSSIYICMPPTDVRRDLVSGILTDARLPFSVFGNVVELTYYVSMLTPRSKGVHNIIITTATKWTMRQKTNYDFIYLSQPGNDNSDIHYIDKGSSDLRTNLLNSIQGCIHKYRETSIGDSPLVCKSDPGSCGAPRVLIVDDHSIHRKTIESILRKMGILKVDTASDYDTGMAAVMRSIRNNKIYSVVLIDLYMPIPGDPVVLGDPVPSETNKRYSLVLSPKKRGSHTSHTLSSASGPVSVVPPLVYSTISGIRLATKIRESSAYSNVKLIGLTHDDTQNTEPFDCVLTKPVSMQDLQSVLT